MKGADAKRIFAEPHRRRCTRFPMKKNLKIAIVGLGWPGQRHAEAVRASPDAVLYAGADLSEERRAQFQKQFAPKKCFADLDETLADPKVDAVVLSLPNFLHFPASMAVLTSGRHVLCEKPPTLNAEEMRLVKEEAEKRGLIYFFGRQSRFSGAMRAARKVVQSGRLGKIYYGKAEWLRSRGIPGGVGGWFTDKAKSGGGALIDLGVHALDAVWYLMGHPRPTSVSGQVFQNFPHYVPAGTKFDVEDAGFAFIKFDNGAVLQLVATWAGNFPEDVVGLADRSNGFINSELHGVKGTIRLNPLELFEDQAGTVVPVPLEPEEDHLFQIQMQHFLDAILGREAPVNSARQAVYLMEMLDAIYTSSATGREVIIEPVAAPESPAGAA